MLALQQTNLQDELCNFQQGRYISSNEAFWRIFAFYIHERSPSVQKLAAHLEEGQRVYFANETLHNKLMLREKLLLMLTSNYVTTKSLLKRYCITNCHLITPGTTKNGVEEREETQLKFIQT
ncbi:hypothetical protein AVEN_151476-1 [Araneus ventricosus]|uniref:Uncharacterized protein n=1 Tax=Araneus ventricosus TaxID=182803 RepID=A0A4Y2RWX4_ARAVE|nr:hypothetical protein AVEN_151476-1 [Araneus ventricosus]